MWWCCCCNYHAAPNLRSDSESDFSPSNSEDDDEAEEHEGKRDVQTKTPSKNTSAAALYKTPSKKGKKAAEVSLILTFDLQTVWVRVQMSLKPEQEEFMTNKTKPVSCT